MAISEDMRDLVCAFGNAKYKQGQEVPERFRQEAWPEQFKACKETFEKLCYEIEELELKAKHWDEHRCY